MELFSPDKLTFKTSALSDVITNSKSKECGPLQLHDINPAISCVESQTKIIVLSFFKLIADVKANFVLWDPKKGDIVYDLHLDIQKQIKHPDNCSVFNQTALIFRAPKQKYEVIRKIRQLGLQLRLAAFRPSDKKLSANSFEFTYVEHKENDCVFCFEMKERTLELPVAKPGVPRRTAGLTKAPNDVLRANQMSPIRPQAATPPTAAATPPTVNSAGVNPLPKLTPKPRMPMLTPRPLPALLGDWQSSQSTSATAAAPAALATTGHVRIPPPPSMTMKPPAASRLLPAGYSDAGNISLAGLKRPAADNCDSINNPPPPPSTTPTVTVNPETPPPPQPPLPPAKRTILEPRKVGAADLPPTAPVKINFSISENNIVEMKVETDLIVAADDAPTAGNVGMVEDDDDDDDDDDDGEGHLTIAIPPPSTTAAQS